ncbi:unnamed protein product, partial [Vitis vinifera]
MNSPPISPLTRISFNRSESFWLMTQGTLNMWTWKRSLKRCAMCRDGQPASLSP